MGNRNRNKNEYDDGYSIGHDGKIRFSGHDVAGVGSNKTAHRHSVKRYSNRVRRIASKAETDRSMRED